ncbi:MAG: DNA internalization-related competence protein ComEC/Rec2 [Caldisericia bacterium]|nr:DNA internalization-related competence protein ComEC/Rec2 [Caldisericia bacterium]
MTPIVICSAVFVSGTVLGLSFQSPWYILISIAAAALSFIIAPAGKKIYKLAIGFLVAGFLLASLGQATQKQDETNFPKQANFLGVAISIDESTDKRLVVDARIKETESNILIGKIVRIYSPPVENLEAGDIVSGSGNVANPAHATNPGQFDFSNYLLRKDVFCIIFTETPLKIEGKGSLSLDSIGVKIRANAFETFSEALPKRYATTMDSMVFGKSDMPKDILDIFQRTGTSHILAASGFNLTILVFASIWLLLWITGSRKTAIVTSIVVAILYAASAGFTPSISRALVMSVLSLSAILLGRKYTAGSGLAFAVILLLAIDPKTIYDPGFQLSFVACLGFFVMTNSFENIIPKKRWYSGIVIMAIQTIFVQMATLPVLAYHFHTFSTVSVASNMVAITSSEIIMPLGALSGFLGMIFRPLGILLCYLAWPILALQNMALGFLASPEWATISIGFYHILVWLAYYTSFTGLCFFICRPKPFIHDARVKKAFLTATIVSVALFGGSLVGYAKSGTTQVTFLDVGHGDSCLIRTSSGKIILVDGGGLGGNSSYDIGERVVVPFLRYLGINRIDYVVASHNDIDHLGGLIPVMEQFRVQNLIGSRVPSGTYKEQDFWDLANSKGAQKIFPFPGQKLDIDTKTSIVFLGPPAEKLGKDSKQINNASVVFKINIDGVDFLFSGDLQEEGMAFEMKNSQWLDADIVKLPHHGGKNTNLESWLGAISPKLSINSNSASQGNGAHRETVEVLDKMKIPVLSTAENGAITFTVENGKYSVLTFKK